MPIKKCLTAFLLLFVFCAAKAQTSDDHFREPLKAVLDTIQARYHVKIRYDEKLVAGREVTYAEWRFRPDLETTLNNVLASQDLNFAPDGAAGRYKIQPFQYHLKTPEEGEAQLEHLASLYSNLEEWNARKAMMKACIIDKLHLSHVDPRPNAAPIVSAIRKMDGYTVQNIAIETLPGLYVAGSLYKPAKVKGKIPVILNPDGHFSRGRYREDCQYRCAMLAKMGAMAFSYDLFGWDGESLLQVNSSDHRKSLVQSIQALNATRILDYLLTLKDVDPNRVGISGASGGGSQTMLMAAIDSRITLSVPVVMTSTYHSGGCPCESGMGIHLCGGGTNNVEIAAMAAPNPQLVVSDGKDWSQHVPDQAMPYLKRIYGFYNKAGNVENAHLPKEGHDYGYSKRIAMYRFVAKTFGLDAKPFIKSDSSFDETKVTIEKENALYAFGDNGEKLPANALKSYDAITDAFNKATGYGVQNDHRYKVGVIDLMLLKRQKLSALLLAKEVGAEGLEIDLGGLGSRPTFDNKLLYDSIRQQYMQVKDSLGLEIASLSMSGYYAQSFCQREQFLQSIQDCIKTMKAMNVKMAFLPLGTQCDLVRKPELRDSVVARLKMVAKLAEAADVVIGVETALDAAGEKALLKDVGSPAIKSSFNFSNAIKNNRSVISELKTLGADNIAQIHCTNDDGVWLQNDPKVDMPAIKKVLDEMSWKGWLIVERSRDASKPRAVRENYSANTAYVKKIFQSAD